MISLSTFPHQEPRFLIPLIFPLILFIVPRLITKNLHTYLFRLWFLFNIFICIIYGHLHQGGLLPALKYIHDIPDLSSDVIPIETNMNKKILITYHTYMPPGYLVTTMSKSEDQHKLQTIIIDLKGARHEEFDLTIERILNEHSMNNIKMFVLLPNISYIDLTYSKQERQSFKLLKQFGTHLDLDHGFDEVIYSNDQQISSKVWDRFKLNLYEIVR